ncbi:ETS translocation variant 2 isoform X2 [Orcinus orca]|uniref:ETS translocation variant 2 isoform X2 n=2 Tax=Orcinus orca TaxID=9733 RepID=UPI002112912C|nr:ETS translocation variant 2 isoform X2 [Orcinus orca]
MKGSAHTPHSSHPQNGKWLVIELGEYWKWPILKRLFLFLFLRYVGLSLLWPLPLRSTGSGRAGSVAMAHRPSRSVACGIFPVQGTNPCPLHRQEDCQPLRHQGSPKEVIFNEYSQRAAMDLWNWDEASAQEVPLGSRLSEGAELDFYFPELALQGDTLTADTGWKSVCGLGPLSAGEGLPQPDWGSALPYPEAPWGAEPAPQPLPWSGDWTDLPCTGSVPWSRVSQALGPALWAGSEGAAAQNCATSAESANSWSGAQVAASSTSWDYSVGPDGATYWGKSLGGEPPADSTISWGGPAGSDYTISWDSGLHTDCTTSSKEYQTSDLTTSSEPSQQSDRATLACYPKANHRGGAAVGRAQEEARHELREAEPRSALLLPPRHRAQERGAQVHVPLRGPRAWPSLSRLRGERTGSNDSIKIHGQASLCVLFASFPRILTTSAREPVCTSTPTSPPQPRVIPKHTGGPTVCSLCRGTRRGIRQSPLGLPTVCLPCTGTCTRIRPNH